MSENSSPYESFKNQDRILRDHLAIDRTVLANERTFLAYVRTALAFVVVGASCFKFFDSSAMDAVGGLFLAAGAVLFGIGIRRTRRVNRRIRGAQNEGGGGDLSQRG
jgi:putative membrane protein